MRLDALVAALVVLLPSGVLAQPLDRPVPAEAPPPIVEPARPATAPPPVVEPVPSLAANRASVLVDSSTLARTLPYDEGQPIPPGYTLQLKRNLGLLIGGATMFGVTYLMAVTVSLIHIQTCHDDEDGRDLGPTCDGAVSATVIPLLGPFIAARAAGMDGLFSAAFVLLGAVQVGGVIMLGMGVGRKRILVREDIAGIQLAPLTYGGALRGMAVAGEF